MRALIQRVSSAQVSVDGEVVGAIDGGLLVFLGVGPDDDEAVLDRLWHKIRHLRIFSDEGGHMNLDVGAVGGSVLVVSQFTLYAQCRKGNRPSFTEAAPPAMAKELYEKFCGKVAAEIPCARGVFGAHMEVALVNDGPVTIWLDTDQL